MVDAARALGHAYFGVGDHGESTVYAKGLPRARVAEQAAEIATINEDLSPFVVFHGTEVDILGDGSLGYPDEVLARFDYVVASIHGQFNMSETEMTNRIVTAMSNPHVTMLGHPTGRVLLSRDGYSVNLQAIIEAAVAHDVILEINAYPNRLDLDWRHVKAARDAGVLLAVNPDAHFTADLEFFRYGVNVARKGWLEAKDLLNTRTVAGVRKYFVSRKKKRGIAT
jgi:DNA polymerase (family 10)